MPKVSVIVPVYNGERHIGKCLDNLINQTFKDIEIVVVNDGSSDNSKKIVEDYVNLDNRIKLINFDVNKGLYEARLSGFEAASSEYICSCDSDDYYSYNSIELMYNKAVETNADIVQSKMICLYDNNIKIESHFNKISYSILENDNILDFLFEESRNWSMCGKLIKKDIFNLCLTSHIRNIHIITNEDLLIFLPIAYYSKKQVSIKRAIYYYDVKSETSSQILGNIKKDKKRLDDILTVFNEVKKFLLKNNLYDKYKVYNSKRLIRDFLYYFEYFTYSKDVRTEYLNKFISLENDFIRYIDEKYIFENKMFKNINFEELKFNNKKEIKKIKSIGIVYHRLYNGGVERVISKLSHIFNEYGYNIVIFTDEKPNDNDYSLPDNIIRVVLSNNNNERYNIFKDNIEKYDIDLIIHNSWMANTLLIDILIIKSIGIKISCILHSVFTVPVYTYDVNKFDRINFFKLLDHSIVLSNTYKKFYEYFGLNNVYYIPNPTLINNESISGLNTKNIIWVGRFELDVKQPILALIAFSKVLKNIPDAKLLIIGSGNSYEEGLVKQKIRELKIENNCRLLGYQTNVEKYFLESSVHLFTSLFEGFPMVLNEAKSYGVPTVMFDLPYLEMVKDNMGLITVPQGDVDSLSDAVIKLLLDDEYRVKLGSEAKSSLDKYSDRNIMNYWEKLFYDIENNKSVDRLELDNEVVNVINELVNAVKFEEKILKKEILENKEMIDKLLPTFFALVLYHNYFIIKLFFIKISAKVNKYYEKPVIISLNNLFRNLFYINSDKKYIYIKILFITITLKK